jgi:hypothetical protein
MGKKNKVAVSLASNGFIVQFLAGYRAVGTEDDNEMIVSSAQFYELKQRVAFARATAEYDEAVKAFHLPLTAAADKLKSVMEQVEDDTFIEALKPEVEGVLSAAAEIVHLSHDTVILRLRRETPIVSCGSTVRSRSSPSSAGTLQYAGGG